MKWEYRYVSTLAMRPDGTLDVLNKLGEDRWEAFATDDTGIWLKRELYPKERPSWM